MKPATNWWKYFLVLLFGISLSVQAGPNRYRNLEVGKHFFQVWGIHGIGGGSTALGDRNSSWPNGFLQRVPGIPIEPRSGSERSCFGAFGTWIGVKDWTSPPHWVNEDTTDDKLSNMHFDYYISEVGLKYSDEQRHETHLDSIARILRQAPPYIEVVEREEATPEVKQRDLGVYDAIDPDIPCDEMFYSRYTHSIGVTVEKRVYTFCERRYDDFAIVEMVFKNTGQTHPDSVTKLAGQTLNDVWFGFGQTLLPQERVAYQENRGEADALTDYDAENRVFYSWDGDDVDQPGNDQWDQGTTGEFLAPAFSGFGILHADVSAQDHNDDPNKPGVTRIHVYSDQDFISYAAQYPTTTAEAGYNFLTTQIPIESPDPFAPSPTKNSHHVGFCGCGPYTLEPNDSVRIVFVKGSNGRNQAECIEAGYLFKEGEINQDSVNQFMWAGKDSLFESFRLAKSLWDDYLKHGLKPQLPPMAPAEFKIVGGKGQVDLSWESVTNAVEYRIYRAAAGNDKPYELLLPGPGSELSYTDTDVSPGGRYYYYITAVDNNALESNVHYTRDTFRGVVPSKAPFTTLDSVVVAPNPWVYSGGWAQYGGILLNETLSQFPSYQSYKEANTLVFFNLPEKCTIKIYTVSGNLINTLEHNGGDLERWEGMLTLDNDFIASGIYLYTVKSDIGNTHGKFVVIR
ncbi:hypothetical protein GF337_12425 [candidate division KSB1 bacterium]|nr:hypothetical protein [candidate division KSB1 bacterium]